VTLLPPAGKVFTGVAMGYDLSDFVRRSGHRPAVWEQFIAFDHSYRWAIDLAAQQHTRLMLALSTSPGQARPGRSARAQSPAATATAGCLRSSATWSASAARSTCASSAR